MKINTLNESDLQRVYIYRIYPRGSKIHLDKGFVHIDSGGMGVTHWCCFIVKYEKSCYFGSFGGQPDDFLINQIPKPLINHIYKIQDKNFLFFGSYCLYFFYLFERINYYDGNIKISFD